MVEVILNMVTTNKLIRLMIIILFSVIVWRMSYYMLGSEVTVAPPIGEDKIATFEDVIKEEDHLLKVAVFYEALCPDSSYYLRRQLLPAYEKLKDFIRVELVPYGKAEQEKRSDGSYKFRCQHGPPECDCNKMHACVAHKAKNDTLSISLTACMIGINMRETAIEAAKQCMINNRDLYTEVEKCYSSPEGEELLWKMGIKTHSLDPEATFIPTITVDGSQDDQNSILKDTTKKLCSLLISKHPKACGG